MSEARTHYDVMGLSPRATPEEIKKRFRELARKYHPDLNREHPEYHEVFVRISQANEILSDPARRAAYDLELRDQARRTTDRRAGAYGSAPYQTPPRPPQPPNGGYARPQGRPSPGPARDERGRTEAERRQMVARLMEDARQAYQRGHQREAIRLCREVLQISRVGAAYEMLGDIYSRQGRAEDAVRNYTFAAQLLPNSSLIMAKLNRVAARHVPRSQPDYGLPSNEIPPRGVPRPENYGGYKLAVACFGLAFILLLMFWRPIPTAEDYKLGWPLVGNWTLTHLFFMALDGFLTGVMLAAGAWIRPIDQELFYQSIGSPRRPMPIGVILGFFGAVFLPVALGIYVVIAYLQQSVSGSVLAAIGAAIALTFGFMVAAGMPPQPDTQMQMETLMFGGNVIFVTLLCGWFVGDLFRPAWAS